MYTLDFTINTAKERCEYIKKQNLNNLTKKELEAIANYLIWGKDSDNKSPVDKKKIYIKTKYKSWSKNPPLSLEELLENPNFDETCFCDVAYKYPRPEINIDQIKDLPTVPELLDTITMIKKKIEEGVEDSKFNYHLKHLLIELRNRQYQIKDAYFPQVGHCQNSKTVYFLEPCHSEISYPVFPCGLIRDDKDLEFKNPYHNGVEFKSLDIDQEINTLKMRKKKFINFMDSRHIYELIVNYSDLQFQTYSCLGSSIGCLLATLDFYIDKANLSTQQRLIVDCKKRRMNNKEIKAVLISKLGINHQENYISTIWNICCRLIAKAASDHYDEWCCKDYDKAWKQCRCCGEFKMIDKRNFMRKRTTADGFSFRCKECERKKRLQGS